MASCPSDTFRVTCHRIPGQHIREYPQATASSTLDDLDLDIKQYEPLDNLQPQPGDVTFILAPGIGFIKELYEPLCASINAQAARHGFRVRAFWIADPAAMGGSGLINSDKLGNEPHWFDHSRDLLYMVNHFRDQMPRPLVGIGHSFGGAQIAYLSSMHPRLFASLVLIEPAISRGVDKQTGLSHARSMIRRRERFADRATVQAAIGKSAYYKRWHPRTVAALLQHGFVEEADGSMRTKNSPHLELGHMYRANLTGAGADSNLQDLTPEQRARVPDLVPGADWIAPLYRSEILIALEALPHVRPSVQYIVGEKSGHGAPPLQKLRMDRTGTGAGGSGGAVHGRVHEHYVKDGQHTIPLDEHLEETAGVAAEWVGAEMRRWRHAEAEMQQEWDRAQAQDKRLVPAATVQVIKEWDGKQWDDTALQKKLVVDSKL